ncbi:MAG TPA: methionyl-tRNA formyltransferase [Candidatus Limnocylindrales bacterium]|nr:methionyl-tRNA formyltransferase [Candidatus Limnocylindrales bacterium]
MTDGSGPAGHSAPGRAGATPGTPVRTVFLGSGRFAQPILGRLAGHPSIELVMVVSAPPRPVGRRQIATPTPVETSARELGLAVQTPSRLRDQAALAALLELDPELVVLADYGQIVPRPILDRRYGALNLHPSLLPRHRGATPIPAAILAGDPETGVTLIRMDPGLDTGPVVVVERAILSGDETTPALEARLAIAAAGILARSLDPWLAGDLVPTPQADEGATLTRPLRRADGRLDPRLPAVALERHVRAFLPWPGSFAETDGDRLVVLAATVADSDPDDSPGRIVPDPAGLAIATGDGRLILDEVQPAGGQPMSGEEYLRGRPRILGRTVRWPADLALPPLFTPAADAGRRAADPA